MTLKIRQVAGKREIRLCLSGQLRSEHLDQLKSELERRGSQVTLDLTEVDLVDIEGVRFLTACESAGVSILHCSAYIREWMLQERGRVERSARGENSHEDDN
jgi:ABC-type transporter Mla MlaB component